MIPQPPTAVLISGSNEISREKHMSMKELSAHLYMDFSNQDAVASIRSILFATRLLHSYPSPLFLCVRMCEWGGLANKYCGWCDHLVFAWVL